MNGYIVIVAHGKGNDKADSYGYRWFATKDEAHDYILRVTNIDTKYWTVAEIGQDGEPIEAFDREILNAGSKDWIK